MKRDKYEAQIRWGIMGMCIVAFYFILLRWNGLAWGFNSIKNILMPIIIGFVIAFILDSMVEKLLDWLLVINKREKAMRSLAILMAEVFMLTIILLLFSIVIPEVISSITNLIANFDGYMSGLGEMLEPYLKDNPEMEEKVFAAIAELEKQLQDFFDNDVMALVLQITTQVKNVGSILYNLIIGFIASMYFLAGKERLLGIFKKLLYSYVETEKANTVIETVNFTVSTFKNFFVGKLLDSAIIGLLCFVGLTILKMPYTMLVSIVVGVTNIIPYFGPFIGAVPSVLLVLVVNPVKALVLLIFIVILQQLDGNVIGPRILGNSIGVSSFGVMFSIIVGGGLFGVLGMVVSVPLYAVICMLIRKDSDKRLTAKKLPLRSADFVYEDHMPPEEWDLEAEEAFLKELEKEPSKEPPTPRRRARLKAQAKMKKLASQAEKSAQEKEKPLQAAPQEGWECEVQEAPEKGEANAPARERRGRKK